MGPWSMTFLGNRTLNSTGMVASLMMFKCVVSTSILRDMIHFDDKFLNILKLPH